MEVTRKTSWMEELVQLSGTDWTMSFKTPEPALSVLACSNQAFTNFSTTLPYRLRNEETFSPLATPPLPPPAYSVVLDPNNSVLGGNTSIPQTSRATEIKGLQLPGPQSLANPPVETIRPLKDHALTLTISTTPLLRNGSSNDASGESCYDTADPQSPLTNESGETPHLPDSSNSSLSTGSDCTPNFAKPSETDRSKLARQQYKAREGVLWGSAKTLLEESFIYPAHLTEAEFETLVCSNSREVKAWINANLPRLIHRAVGQWFRANQKLRSAGISPSDLSETFLDVFEWMISAEQDFFIQNYKKIDQQAFKGNEALRLTARQREKLMVMAGPLKEDYLKAYANLQLGSPRGKSGRSSESFRSNVETLKRANQKRLQVLQERIRTLEKIEHSVRRFDSLRLSMESSESSDTSDSTLSYISPLDTCSGSARSLHNSTKAQTSHDAWDEQLIVRKRGSRDCEDLDSAQVGKRPKHRSSLRSSSLGSMPFATDSFPMRCGDYVEDTWDRFEHLVNSTNSKSTEMPTTPNFISVTTETCEKPSRNRWIGILTPRTAADADNSTVTNDRILIKNQAAQALSQSRFARSISSDIPETVFVTNLGVAWCSMHITHADQVENQKPNTDSASKVDTPRRDSGIDMETNTTSLDRNVTVRVIEKKSSMTTIMSACSSSVSVVVKNVPCATPDLGHGDAKSTHGILDDPRYSQVACESLYQDFEHSSGASIYPTSQERKRSVRKKLSRFFGSLRLKKAHEEVNF
ncbi:hypothetical protein B0J14DRAFT_110761 [Halenospora varia]|nr:hypothetical protein B0J14DRAFT_110761 [Halenospora varia]